MHIITFISTIHAEIGRCNAEELNKIIERLSPEVIFLEALADTYSEYQKHLFTTFGVYHNKLELSALQKYSHNTSFEYVPVCENALSDNFHRKNEIVCQNRDMQQLIDNFNSLAAKHGFNFLNSLECINLQQEMRDLERRVLNNSELYKIVETDIHAYENQMIRNIYSYSKNKHFNAGIFMCGAAHRKSTIEKLEKSNTLEQVNLTWTIFEG